MAMLHDVLNTLNASPDISGIVVVSDDLDAALVAADLGCEYLPETALQAHGLNGVVTAVVRRLAARGIDDVLVVHGDLPMLTAAELSTLLQMHANAGDRAVTIAADRHRSGSNCVAVSPARCLRFQFGENSLGKHITGARESGLKSTVLILPGAGLDIDTPDDLSALRGVIDQRKGSRTAQCLWSLDDEPPQFLPVNDLISGQDSAVALHRPE
jgi:2-phospho-L-lactate guanylyltransferase